MKYLVLTMRLPGFDPAAIPDHYEFLAGLRERGLIQEAGPFTDSSGGAYVLNAGSLDEARVIADGDPLRVRGCSSVTVREWDAR